MTDTTNPSQVRVLVWHVGAQGLSSAPGTEVVLLFTPCSRVFSLLHDKLSFFDQIAFSHFSWPSLASDHRL